MVLVVSNALIGGKGYCLCNKNLIVFWAVYRLSIIGVNVKVLTHVDIYIFTYQKNTIMDANCCLNSISVNCYKIMVLLLWLVVIMDAFNHSMLCLCWALVEGKHESDGIDLTFILFARVSLKNIDSVIDTIYEFWDSSDFQGNKWLIT